MPFMALSPYLAIRICSSQAPPARAQATCIHEKNNAYIKRAMETYMRIAEISKKIYAQMETAKKICETEMDF